MPNDLDYGRSNRDSGKISMYAIEFEADLHDGILTLPDRYKTLKNQHVRVVILLDNRHGAAELRALSNHSAALIDEWHDPSEDDIWR